MPSTPAAHDWKEYKPRHEGAATLGITHTCDCGASKGSRPYKADKGCALVDLRKAARECAACFRVGLVTQAFTSYVCAGCAEEKSHANGDTPAYCEPCSLKLACCRKCGQALPPEESRDASG